MFRKFYRKTHALEAFFNKVMNLRSICNFINKRLQHWCFPEKFAKFSATPVLKNVYERLLLRWLEFEIGLLSEAAFFRKKQ